jgi:hypothetical protein
LRCPPLTGQLRAQRIFSCTWPDCPGAGPAAALAPPPTGGGKRGEQCASDAMLRTSPAPIHPRRRY